MALPQVRRAATAAKAPPAIKSAIGNKKAPAGAGALME
jgi:hypothetical protein